MQHLIMQPHLQHPSQPLHPSMELLAAMEGWDPMRMYNLAQLGGPLGGKVNVTSLEGAGRMGQEGGVMSRSMPVRPSQPGTATPLITLKVALHRLGRPSESGQELSHADQSRWLKVIRGLKECPSRLPVPRQRHTTYLAQSPLPEFSDLQST